MEKIIKSRKFRKALRRAGEITLHTNRETSVTAWIENKKVYAMVMIGQRFAMRDEAAGIGNDFVPGFDDIGFAGKGVEDALYIHFHPESGAIYPSYFDLETFWQDSHSTGDFMSFVRFEGIAKVEKKSRKMMEVKVIFLSPPTAEALGILDEKWSLLPQFLPEEYQEEINSWLEEAGVRTRMETFCFYPKKKTPIT